MSLACVLSLAIFWVLLQSWELCLVLGIVRYLVLAQIILIDHKTHRIEFWEFSGSCEF